MRSAPAEDTATETGGSALVASTLIPIADEFRLIPRPRLTSRALPRWVTAFRASRRAKGIASDVFAVVLAVLDVWLVIPEDAPGYSLWLSGAAVAAMVMRRHVPFLAVLVTVPGFLTGWSQLAAMVALGTLAKRRGWSWQLVVSSILVFSCYFIIWPLSEFVAMTWREHALDVIWGVIVAGMPIAIGMLFTARQELSARITELANSREREKALYTETVRAAERTKLAREMHDVVSHQVTLIAMQAGALQVATKDDAAKGTAMTIRELSTRTLDELRNLVGVLRSGDEADGAQPGLDELGELVRNFRSDAVPVALDVNAEPSRLPRSVSHAVYRTVQEALTNVRKHASGARASVKVVAQQDTLLVEVRNGRAGPPQPALPSGGHGLIGLRERAGLLGGTFQAGPTSEGGFRVAATYPLAG
ncbi:MAG: sensor histidine kinase [Actinophytocola sp.]|uniref:sensor histidine kinase n=1 Tax=Actinophytocola sp. TaxID=1872138 RepID=UPI00132AB322|nr:histidine kinase [Actinophytocola sp.]MPZ80416.1 sensor histidine kinase [Actinophytocola sp.]